MEKIQKNQEKEIPARGEKNSFNGEETCPVAAAPASDPALKTAAPFPLSKEEAEKKKKEEAEKKKKRAAAKAYRDKYFAYYDDVKTKVSEDW